VDLNCREKEELLTGYILALRLAQAEKCVNERQNAAGLAKSLLTDSGQSDLNFDELIQVGEGDNTSSASKVQVVGGTDCAFSERSAENAQYNIYDHSVSWGDLNLQPETETDEYFAVETRLGSSIEIEQDKPDLRFYTDEELERENQIKRVIFGTRKL
jgi:hypothetical protein